jgi:hypothetical protein
MTRRIGVVAVSAVLVAALVVGLHLAIAARAGTPAPTPAPAARSSTAAPIPGDAVTTPDTGPGQSTTSSAELSCPDDVLCSDATTCPTVDDDTGGEIDNSAIGCADQASCSPTAADDGGTDSGSSCEGYDSSPP